jgi:hypothetical protein
MAFCTVLYTICNSIEDGQRMVLYTLAYMVRSIVLERRRDLRFIIYECQIFTIVINVAQNYCFVASLLSAVRSIVHFRMHPGLPHNLKICLQRQKRLRRPTSA